MFDNLWKMRYYSIRDAEVSELADEQDSGSCERYAREGSSPFFRMVNPGGRRLRGFDKWELTNKKDYVILALFGR